MQKLFAQVATAALILSSYACSDVSNLRQSSSNTSSTPEVSTNLASAAKILSDSYCGTVKGFKLSLNETLVANECLLSNNKKSLLVMQEDGNLVLYNTADANAMWSSETFQPGSFLANQIDGNLVIYSGTSVIWQTATTDYKAGFLSIQDDQNLVLYLTTDSGFIPAWSSKYGKMMPEATASAPSSPAPAAVVPVPVPAPAPAVPAPAVPAMSAFDKLAASYCGKVKGFKISARESLVANECLHSENKGSLLVMQADGNLVLYKVSDKSVLWQSRTFSAGSKLLNQADGNLIIYNKFNEAIGKLTHTVKELAF